jgi:PAS domain S-box-containing protein
MKEEASSLHDRFFDLSIDMLCIAHFDGHFSRLNPAWEKALGFSREELQSRPMFEFVHPDDRERTLEQNRKVRSGGQAIEFENRYRCKDGSYRWLRWNATADLAHQLIYSVARDITAARQAESERERLLQDLQDALAEVKELRTTLPICMYCKNIRDDENYWQTVEKYISNHTHTTFSHGICPICYHNIVEPQLGNINRK